MTVMTDILRITDQWQIIRCHLFLQVHVRRLQPKDRKGRQPGHPHQVPPRRLQMRQVWRELRWVEQTRQVRVRGRVVIFAETIFSHLKDKGIDATWLSRSFGLETAKRARSKSVRWIIHLPVKRVNRIVRSLSFILDAGCNPHPRDTNSHG